ncbi:MAG: PIG-L family deacetylase [Chitinophagales bacterium]|nr:PIG-L family deacetylase [Chitinophagales bacterium]
MSKIANLLLVFTLLSLSLAAQAPEKLNSVEIFHRIQKLNFLGSALYVAAHPDDENQRLISYLSNELNANTTYIAMTRGDGGQNEIGPEIRELLGVIRTQELLAARGVDGGYQHFSRANDFGFSKNPEETLDKWGHDQALADMVWAIRKWQPDIIINRFQHTVDPKWVGRMHGHHTASAMLSHEAFDLTNDPTVFPEQLKYVDAWQPKRLFFNTSWWFYGSRENFAKADKTRLMGVDVGTYYPLLGKSNTEIAAAARSMHKAQGFGDMGTRGSQTEYLELLKGDMPTDKEALFEGINTTWTRLEGGAAIGRVLAKVEANYQFGNPAASVADLLQAKQMIEKLADSFWKSRKLIEIEEVIQACLGLSLEVVAEDDSGIPGGEAALAIEAINRSSVPVTLKHIYVLPTQLDTALNLTLEYNEGNKIFKKVQLPADMKTSSPYWLKNKWEDGYYKVDDQQLIGLPEASRPFEVVFELDIAGKTLKIAKKVVYKYEDAVKGEVYQPFEITPPVFVEIPSSVYVFGDDKPQIVSVAVKAGAANVNGHVQLCFPDTWSVSPDSIPFSLEFKGQVVHLDFELTPPQEQEEGAIVPLARVDGIAYSDKQVIIDYPHLPVQKVLLDASAKVAKVEIATAGHQIGYIMGLGDEIPASLEQIGYEVTLLDPAQLTAEQLNQYDAIVLGVRVYNGVEDARQIQPLLFEYAKNGGTVVVQYNKNYGMTVGMDELSPYPIKISRDRVTVEDAPVRMLAPDHPVLNWPNKITKADFDGWVQERGLYFPNEWGDEYVPIISSNDPNEPPRDGGLLVARHGEGYYVYTGYSWFRQLPAGVPGAFRIFANMVSLGQER